MVHPYYAILDNLYNLTIELNMLKKKVLVSSALEDAADKLLYQIMDKNKVSAQLLKKVSFELPRHQQMFDRAQELLEKAPYDITSEDKSLLLATFGYRLEKGDKNDLF